jgi:alpha-1,2-mannosyltransferase
MTTQAAGAPNVVVKRTRRPLRVSSRPVGVRGRTTTTAWVSALVGLSVVAALLVVQPYRIDLDVYRIGAQAWLDGQPLYGQLAVTQAGLSLPFTYPPAAAILFAPLAVVPFGAANALVTVSSVTALIALLVLAVGPSKAAKASRAVALALLAASLLAEPVMATLGFGQVNLVLAAMVALDVLAPRTWWPRGLLIGIATAVKLTPAVFVLALLVRRQYRAAATAALTSVAVSLLAWVAAPQDSQQYWTSTLWDPDRIGGAAYAGNQSINGLLLRLGLTGTTERVAWLIGAALVVALAWAGMKHAERRGDIVLLLGLNGLVALLASPVSWTHHWVWLLPLCMAMWDRNDRSAWRTMAAVGAILMLLRPMWWLPREAQRELDWAPWQQIPGNAYVVFGVALLLLAASHHQMPALRRRRLSAGRESGPRPETTIAPGPPGAPGWAFCGPGADRRR